jgi:hypothetical protein
MSAIGVPFPLHRIAILMSVEGRFLECQNCFLRIEFAAGAHYEVIAKQFESHSCSCAIPSKDNAPGIGGWPRLAPVSAVLEIREKTKRSQ